MKKLIFYIKLFTRGGVRIFVIKNYIFLEIDKEENSKLVTIKLVHYKGYILLHFYKI